MRTGYLNLVVGAAVVVVVVVVVVVAVVVVVVVVVVVIAVVVGVVVSIVMGGREKGIWIKYQGYLVPSSTDSGRAELHVAAIHTVKKA